MLWLRLLLCIGICEAAGLLASLFTRPGVRTWYPKLRKPAQNPPAWLFAPVWVLLYLLMGVALYYIWGDTLSMIVFGVQLVLNVLWSVLFFGLRKPGLALVEIVVLWIAILFATTVLYAANPIAGWLMLPYLAWTGFAAYLNYSIWKLNKKVSRH